MKMALSVLSAVSVVLGISAVIATPFGDGLTGYCDPEAGTIYGFNLMALNGTTEVPLSVYDGKVLLLVNVASFCDFTDQYLGLNLLMEEPRFKGRFEVLGVPSNQFGMKEPGADEYEIKNSLEYCRPGHGFEPNFDLFQKSDVNGADELPLYTALKSACPAVKVEIGDPTQRFWTPFRNNDITWNFNKFLIGADGTPLKRYDSLVEPDELLEDITGAIDGPRAAGKGQEVMYERRGKVDGFPLPIPVGKGGYIG